MALTETQIKLLLRVSKRRSRIDRGIPIDDSLGFPIGNSWTATSLIQEGLLVIKEEKDLFGNRLIYLEITQRVEDLLTMPVWRIVFRDFKPRPLTHDEAVKEIRKLRKTKPLEIKEVKIFYICPISGRECRMSGNVLDSINPY